MKIIVSFSGGKDSTWMLLEMIRRKEHIDEVVYFDTGWEFPQMVAHVEKIKALVKASGITFTTLHPEKPFDYWMFDHKKENGENGYSWCGKNGCRWGTSEKVKAIQAHLKNEPEHIQCVGIAADEPQRITKEPNKRYPLFEWGFTERQCLKGCYEQGYDFGGLYKKLDRVSCKFCNFKNLKELRNIYWGMRDVWKELEQYQRRTNLPYGDKESIFDLETRFWLEKEFMARGKPINSKEFHDRLKEKQFRNFTNPGNKKGRKA